MSINIAVVGATGNVGREMLAILASKKFDSKNIFPVASSRSEGSRVDFGDDQLTVESIEKFDPSKVQIALFSRNLQKRTALLLIIQAISECIMMSR